MALHDAVQPAVIQGCHEAVVLPEFLQVHLLHDLIRTQRLLVPRLTLFGLSGRHHGDVGLGL
jgi:hypothetical protein